ncbi:hypothetical protein [Tetragenococcus halophilus]
MSKEIELNLSKLADGGAWRNQAIVNIREYLKEELADEIKNGKIVLLA